MIQLLIRILICVSTLFSVACTVPSANDFQSPDRPLAEDEFIVIWRYSHYPLLKEVIDPSKEHAQAMDAQMDPLFQQLIPRVFSDLKDGKLVLRVEDDITNLDEQPITDLPKQMRDSFGGSWQNLIPFMGTFHISQRRKETDKGFDGEELELVLIAQDPQGQLPEKYVGSVRFADLARLGYTIDLEEKSYDLLSYLTQSLPFAYPIYYQTTEMAAGMYTLEQAFSTKQMMIDGEWAGIEWLAGQPNLSGMKMKPLTYSELQEYVGVYVFPSGQPYIYDNKFVTIEVSIEDDHLYCDWTKQWPFHANLMFPAGDDKFFSINGQYRVQFASQLAGRLEMRVMDKKGVEIVGVRE